MARTTRAVTRKPTRAPTRGRAPGAPRPHPGKAPWTFLTNHAHVLICIAADPAARIGDLAARVGITYRGVQRILGELIEAGYLSAARSAADARSNVYRIDDSLPLRHPVERHRPVAALIALGARER